MSATNSEIVGLGTDIIEIDRIAHVLERHGQSFLERILTQHEREYCARYRDLAPHLAVRFSAKEAVSKALGVGIGRELNWLDMEIFHDEKGAPHLRLSSPAQSRFPGVKILISLSHCKAYANAVALAVRA